MKISQQFRLALESTEEREARLQRMSLSQQSRLASEMMEERLTYSKLETTDMRDYMPRVLQRGDSAQRDRDHHRQQQAIDPQISMFEQQSVRTRMTKFHSELASLHQHILFSPWIVILKNAVFFFSGGQAFANAYFGEGNGSIFLDNVQCSPNNTDILQCHSNPIGSHNCTQSNDAGVRCEGKQHKLICIYIIYL